MVDLDRPSRRGSARTLFLALVMLSAAVAEPVAVSPRWQVTFPAAAQGKAAQSTAVPVGDGFVMVAVVAPGADPLRPLVTMGNRSLPVKLIGHDPVTRLAFLEAEGIMPKSTRWLPEVGALSGSVLTALEPGGATKCHAAGWAKQVGKKVLPLALLQVNFSQAVPPPGTALVDEAGQVAALVFQGSGSGNTGFAIPAEAIHRVRRDVCDGGSLERGWLGLALRADARTPQISRVLPDSPAANAGIRQNDLLVGVGSRSVTDYADAVNAFFYLVPGKPVTVKLLRNAAQIEFTLTPAKSP